MAARRQGGPDASENDITEAAKVEPTHEAKDDINANGNIANDTNSSFSENFDGEARPYEEFQVPREPDRPERRYREFKGRHIQMMALGNSRQFHD